MSRVLAWPDTSAALILKEVAAKLAWISPTFAWRQPESGNGTPPVMGIVSGSQADRFWAAGRESLLRMHYPGAEISVVVAGGIVHRFIHIETDHGFAQLLLSRAGQDGMMFVERAIAAPAGRLAPLITHANDWLSRHDAHAAVGWAA